MATTCEAQLSHFRRGILSFGLSSVQPLDKLAEICSARTRVAVPKTCLTDGLSAGCARCRVLCLAPLPLQLGGKGRGHENGCWQHMEIFFDVKFGGCLLFFFFEFSFTQTHVLVQTTVYLVVSLSLTTLTETSLKLRRY